MHRILTVAFVLLMALAVSALLGGSFALRGPMVGSSQAASGAVSVLTRSNDIGRTGANLAETTLTTANVNVGQFGLLFTRAVDGAIYGQPLYVPNVAIPGQGTHNVVYVVTMHDSVYAFDADDPTQSTPLWSRSLGTAVPLPDANNNCLDGPTYTDISHETGIISTPVIDPASNTLYVVAMTRDNSAPANCGSFYYSQHLHALDITTGAEKPGSPVLVTGSVPGTGVGSVNGTVTLRPWDQNQRMSLLLLNKVVYFGFGSFFDSGMYHGWVFSYNADPASASFLHQVAVYNDTPNGDDAGIWQSGQGPSVDGAGNIYVTSGNGDNNGTTDFGDSTIKLSPSLAVQDWFSPYNNSIMETQDLDFGSTGVLPLPGSGQAVVGSKVGKLYLLNEGSLGHFHAGSDSQIPQSFLASSGELHGSPVYWNGPSGPEVYVQGNGDFAKAFKYTGSSFVTTPASQSTTQAPAGDPGGILSISANGGMAGSGIVWDNLPVADAAINVVGGVLRAFDANDLSHELWDSTQNAARDAVGNYAKFSPPTIANGRVYLATFSNRLDVYGLLNAPPTPTNTPAAATPTNTPAVATATNTQGASGDPLAPFRNNAGISHDANPTAANLDGLGYSYSFEALQAAGVSPGGTVSSGGFSFRWPNVQPGSPDNVAASGQTIPLAAPSGATSLGLLGAAVNGNTSAAGTLTYTDGSSQPFTLALTDWFNPPAFGNTIAVTTAYRNSKTGRDSRPFYLFSTSIPLTAGKTLKSITLPTNGNLHLFSLATGSGAPPPTPTNTPAGATPTNTPAAATATNTPGGSSGDPLAPFRNNAGISHDANPTAANFDTLGYSYSFEALQAAGVSPGGTVSSNGFTFPWPNVQPGAADNVAASGQTIPLAAPSGATSLGLLGAAVNGNTSAAGTLAYTDGSSQPFTLGLTDWFNPPAFGNAIAVTTAYRNSKTGRDSRPFYLFSTSIPLTAGKTLKSITLPTNGNLHLFSVATGSGAPPPTPTNTPAGATPTNTPAAATATNTPGGSSGDPLAPFRNNAGVSHDANPTAANLDGLGYSYSFEALQAAGVSPGGTVSSGGFSFPWPNVQPGAADNVAAGGQTIPLASPAGATSLGLLGAAVNGNTSAAGTLAYTDGSSQPFTLALTDWFNNPPAFGNAIAVTMAYRNGKTGPDNRPFYLFSTSIPLASGKTLKSVTLPSNGNLHLFSVKVR